MKTREEILQMVENEDVEFIRLQFTDMFGTLKNVAVTATQLQYMKDNRYLIDGSCMYGELRTGEEDMYLCPDLDTFVILPWRPQQGKVQDFCVMSAGQMEHRLRSVREKS